MKSACLFLVSFVCLTVSVQCYGGRRIDTFREIIRAQRMKGSSTKYVSEDALVGDYAPVYIGSQDGLKEADMITDLPGQPEVSFSQYSGYVTVDPNAGRALFYYFTESTDSSSNPLVLWLNGGPTEWLTWSVTPMQWAPTEPTVYKFELLDFSMNCRAWMLVHWRWSNDGAWPFRVNPDGKSLWHNQNAWNNIANVIFLESPAGVGFSYSNTSSDYTTGDKKTAADAYIFLVNWLERFPEYKTRDFYITGESYAGHYVPQLAALVLENNKITNQTVINLKGITIGNAYIDADDYDKGGFDYYWTHALNSDEIHEGIVQNCNFTSGATESQACQDYVQRAYKAIGNIDNYNIYSPLCNSSSTASSASGFDPCSDNYVYNYLNTPEVQKALHANVTGIRGPWASCSDFVNYSTEDIGATIIPTIKGLMASDISLWLYSGDTDSVVPVTATKYSLDKIGALVKTPWYPWYTQGEVGGYVIEYQNLTYVTVRGSGHFVPSDQPERALTMFASFLEGKLPPTKG